MISLALGFRAGALAEPNFNGEWKMDPSRSNFAPLPAPDSMSRKVTLHNSRLKIVTTQFGQQRQIITELNYTTDGKPCRNNLNGKDVTGSARWDGESLVIESKREMQGMQIGQKETWTLSGDGQTLTIANHVQTPQAGFDITIVLEKQPS